MLTEDVIKALHEALGTKTPLELMKKIADTHKDQFSEEVRELLSEFREIHVQQLAADVQDIKIAEAVERQVAHQRENPPSVETKDYREYKADIRTLLDMAQAQGLELSRAHSGSRKTKWACFKKRMDEDLKEVDPNLTDHRKAVELQTIWGAEDSEKDLPSASTIQNWIKKLRN